MKTQLPKNWRKVKLGDVADVKTGSTDVKDAVEHGRYPLFDRSLEIKRSKKYLFDDNAIILPGEGRDFLPRFYSGKFDLHQRAYAIFPHQKEVDSRYLYYAVLKERGILSQWAVGSTVKSLRMPIIKSVPIVLPSLDTQRRIAAILSAFDDKIELNNKINQTLEQIARAIFKEWFVKFRFPGHEKVKFIDSESGRIPEGWEVRKAGEILELAYGKALKDINRHRGNVPVYGSNGRVGWHDEKLVSGPGIIIGRKGNPGLVTWSQTDFYPIDTTFYVVLKNNYLSLHYLYYVLERQNLPDLAADSAVPGLNRNLVYMNEIIIPSKALIDLFDKQITDIRERIQKNCIENANLAALRDSLLPKLMSGEMRV